MKRPFLKAIAGLSLLGAFIGVTPFRKDVNCTFGGKHLEGSLRVYKLSSIPLSTYFNYRVTEGKKELDRRRHFSVAVDVIRDGSIGIEMADDFCDSGRPLPKGESKYNILSYMKLSK